MPETTLLQRDPLTLADIIQRNALYFAGDVGWVHGTRRVTHAEFLRRSARLANAWHAMGLRSQDRVAVLSMNGPEICEVYGAGEISRLITATVNFRLAGPEMRHVINDAGAGVLVFEAQYASLIDGIRASLPGVEHFVCIGAALPWAKEYEAVLESAPMTDEFSADVAADDIAHLIYTSGTTGKPKGVILEHQAVARNAEMLNGCMRACAGDKMLLMMPIFHVGAKAMQVGQHWRGGTVHLHRTFDPALVLETIHRERITITHMAPTMIQMMLDHPAIRDFDLTSLRMIAYSAAPMPEAVLRRGLDVLGPVFTQLYGLTEGAGTVLSAADHRLEGSAMVRERLRSVGVPFPGVALKIVDGAGRSCAPRTPGEILLRGPVMMRGYWNSSSATMEALRDGWLHTGDIGMTDENGYVFLVDRKKDMIVSGGENIYSREVEEALYQHPGVAAAAVIGIPDLKWGEAIRAVVQTQADARVTEAELIEHCRTLIAGYKRPRSVVFVQELPKLASGKIDKKEIRRLHGVGPAAIVN